MTIQLFVIFFLTILNIIIYIKYSHILTCEGVEELCSSSKKDAKDVDVNVNMNTQETVKEKVKVLDINLPKERIGNGYSSKMNEIFNLCNQIIEYDKNVKKDDKLQSSIIISIDKLIKFYKEKNFSGFDAILSSLKFILKSVYINNPHLIELRMIIL